jgi:ABC-2 type transport system permease protein
MKNLYPIYKKELAAYFTSPIAYVVIAVFLVFSGFWFYAQTINFWVASKEYAGNPEVRLNLTEAVVTNIIWLMSFFTIFVIPGLTMRLYSEEKKLGTMELLFTYPVKDIEVVLGKGLACFTVYTVMLGFTLLYAVLLFVFGQPEIGPLVTGYIGLLLIGFAFIMLGGFFSSLTENQIIAYILGAGILMLMWVLRYFADFFSLEVGKVFTHLSTSEYVNNFSIGVFDTKDLIFYVNFSIFFIFLTLRSLESKKWRG